LTEETSFQRTLASTVQCDGGQTTLHEDRRAGMKMLVAEFPADKTAALTTTQKVSTRNWSIALGSSSSYKKRSIPAHAAAFLEGTRYVPVDGIVKAKADEITKGADSDVEKTHAIYNWIVDNTHRDPKVRGCGVGDIRPMLETGDLGGQVRGSQRTLRRPGQGLRHSSARCIRHSFGSLGSGVQEPRRLLRARGESAALPR
jgi:hypothetical protein